MNTGPLNEERDEALARVQLMAQEGSKWDLSPNDRRALKRTLMEIIHLREMLHDARAFVLDVTRDPLNAKYELACELLKNLTARLAAKEMPMPAKEDRSHVEIDTIEEVRRVLNDDGIPMWELKTREGSEFMEEVCLRAEHFNLGAVVTIRERIKG